MTALEPRVLHDFERASQLEWIETNGLGGWAGSSVTFANTRRYHGMLVAALPGRTERTVLVSKLDETVNSVDLGTNRFPDVIHPRGFERLVSFERGVFPVWQYVAGGVKLRKTVVAPHGENLTIVLYEVLDCAKPFELRLSPFVAGRDYHSLIHCTDASLPFIHIDVPGATFKAKPDCWKEFDYERERERGLDYLEDLFTPGSYVVTLKRGDVLPVVIGVEDADWDALGMIEDERARREALVIGTRDDFARCLRLAADQFLIERDEKKTIIAGYHWFTDWGRDTMIALPGLCLATGRFDDAKQILRHWLAAASKGMIPNRFPDGTNEPEFNSADAGLWLFIAVWRYREATNDDAFVRDEALPVLREAINWLDRGTRFGIHVDLDGLLYAGANGVALTWMDAIVNGQAVTPRRGKPVEINALWYNALRIVAELSTDSGLRSRADGVRESFEAAFWNRHSQCCYDVVNPNDASIRPNQLLAISLPFPLFDDARAEEILGVCEAQLLTPVGLRTLSPTDPRYRGRLVGDQHSRDTAYHQGTVWPWLLGPFIDALLRYRGETGIASARALLANLQTHLNEAGLGTIGEIFDGEPPHTPRGCIAQAWSVGEVLRALAKLSS
ncbi:MAG: glycogen debranching enzyme family protein [Acidobacteria bacterium]|nr:glycogen debranching enzyme family protein [Acidobacteriota bacterium]MBV9188474.1 glycogen debranching enzyme family protein [Acidobacteriota bacterium]